jgi:hypothetical protein
MGSIAYNISEKSRETLLAMFTPKYAEVRCHHITVVFGVACNVELPAPPKALEVVGYASDESGIECLVVAVDGSTKREDGSTFHITLSRGAERKSVESNDVLKEHGWTKLETPVAIEAAVAFNE